MYESSIYHKLEIDELIDEQLLTLFIFIKEVICALCDALGILIKIVRKNRTVCSGIEALYVD